MLHAQATNLDGEAVMGRSHPPNIPGATYHVMNRGNRKARIFEDDRDRIRFVQLFVEAAATYGVEILVLQLMRTHFHAVVTTPRGNLSAFMRQFQGEFARYSNWRHARVGHLFQRRFRRVIIENDVHLLIAVAYVFDNPLKSRLVNQPQDWRWGTYAATVGLAPVEDYLSLEWVESLFPSETLAESQAKLRECIENPMQIPSYLDAVDATSRAAIRCFISERLHLAVQPCRYEHLIRPPLELLFASGQSRADFAATTGVAHQRYGYKIAEIARHVGRKPTTISKIYCRWRRQTGRSAT